MSSFAAPTAEPGDAAARAARSPRRRNVGTTSVKCHLATRVPSRPSAASAALPHPPPTSSTDAPAGRTRERTSAPSALFTE